MAELIRNNIPKVLLSKIGEPTNDKTTSFPYCIRNVVKPDEKIMIIRDYGTNLYGKLCRYGNKHGTGSTSLRLNHNDRSPDESHCRLVGRTMEFIEANRPDDCEYDPDNGLRFVNQATTYCHADTDDDNTIFNNVVTHDRENAATHQLAYATITVDDSQYDSEKSAVKAMLGFDMIIEGTNSNLKSIIENDKYIAIGFKGLSNWGGTAPVYSPSTSSGGVVGVYKLKTDLNAHMIDDTHCYIRLNDVMLGNGPLFTTDYYKGYYGTDKLYYTIGTCKPFIAEITQYYEPHDSSNIRNVEMNCEHDNIRVAQGQSFIRLVDSLPDYTNPYIITPPSDITLSTASNNTTSESIALFDNNRGAHYIKGWFELHIPYIESSDTNAYTVILYANGGGNSIPVPSTLSLKKSDGRIADNFIHFDHIDFEYDNENMWCSSKLLVGFKTPWVGDGDVTCTVHFDSARR